jgi:hypothetical protein
MGKGQVSEKELERSIKSLGGLTGLASSAVRRDSPFGSEFVKNVPPQAREPLVLEKVIDLDVKTEPELPPASESRPEVTPLPKATKAKREIPTAEEEEELDGGARLFTERTTLKMTAVMRDDLHYLARKLQRRRQNKDERITSNTVIRVAIQLILDELKLKDTDVANSEAELFSLVKKKLLSK